MTIAMEDTDLESNKRVQIGIFTFEERRISKQAAFPENSSASV